jgi:electron transport complex protein RnfG
VKDLAKMVLVLTAICAVAALALSQVYAVTKEPIAKAKRAEKLAAIKAVLPAYDNEPDRDAIEISGRTYYRGTNNSVPVGFAFAAVSRDGYSGDIKVMVGVDIAGDISGLIILDHKETPGLGQKIEAEKWRDKVIWKDDAKTTRRNLANTKWNVVKDGGEIDQISGATISPRAVVDSVHKGLEDFDKSKDALLQSAPSPAPVETTEKPEVTP